MILYMDTSAFVKTLVREAHSDELRSWAEAAEAVATSVITLPETTSAVARRLRAGEIASTDAARLRRTLAARWQEMMRLIVDEERAADLAWRAGLRGMDAVQLAAACVLNDAIGAGELAFCAFDDRLREAAAGEGLIVLEPSSAS